MDQGAVDSPVTLIIRAPNQKYDDQTINCFLNWTVEKLKAHLSNVYPSKPLSKDQRLVYSGRLLLDHLQLRDILRKQDEYHMVHLVCASRSPPASPCPPTGSQPCVTSDPDSSSSEGSSSLPAATPTTEGTPGPSVGNSDGLRHRGGLGHNLTYPNFMQGQFPLQEGMPAGFSAYPMYNPMQMLWWQQAYARQYYMQYQAAVASSQTPGPAVPSTSFTPPLPTPSFQQPAQPNDPPPVGPNPAPAPAPAPEENPANPNIQMNAQGGALLNEDELNRDWLDWIYTVSRAAILLSIVYFYSSFSRFVMVIGAMVLVYLHQVGWFPFRPDLGAGAEGNEDDHEADHHDDIQEMERIMDEGLEDEEVDGGDEGPGDPANEGAQQPGFLASTWAFITTFFTSLIPEGAAQPAN